MIIDVLHLELQKIFLATLPSVVNVTFFFFPPYCKSVTALPFHVQADIRSCVKQYHILLS